MCSTGRERDVAASASAVPPAVPQATSVSNAKRQSSGGVARRPEQRFKTRLPDRRARQARALR